ncbi:MAG: hypothetical protein ACLU99_02365 [Alphaproteobacteria bacterium]
MSNTVIVGGAETFSVVDYPGKLAAVVFCRAALGVVRFVIIRRCRKSASLRILSGTDL